MLAIKTADILLWWGKFLGRLFLKISRPFIVLLQFLFLPIIIFVYKRLVFLKMFFRGINFRRLNYLWFIRKYLPGILIASLIIIVTTNNIFAQSYSPDEFARRTLLSKIVVDQTELEASELVEETGPAVNLPQENYWDSVGSLAMITPDNPMPADNIDNGPSNISSDASSLVQLTPDTPEGVPPEDYLPTRGEAIVYVVQSGDTLTGIADKFDVTTNTIVWENKLEWNSTIKPGQKLTILPSSGINHEVQKGDTVISIAKKYQTEAAVIIEANQLASASDIASGDLLFIPNGIKPTKVVSSYKPKTTPTKPTSAPSEENYAPVADLQLNSKLLWPVTSHRITQYFSWKHHGLDIGDKTGNPIYAAESGKIERSGWSKGYGNNVIINHGNGITTLYGHASKLLVQAGDVVNRGDIIALVGSTGWSTGPHLHLEVRVSGATTNPLNYIK